VRHEGALYPQVESVLGDVNSYGSYLVLTLFVAWAEYLTERVRWVRTLAAVALVITLCMVPLAGSRIAIIAASACAGVAWTILSRSTRQRLIRGTVLAALASAILLSSFLAGRWTTKGNRENRPGVYSRVVQRFAEATNAGVMLKVWHGGRQAMWLAGIRMVKERPIFGQGPGTFVNKLGNYYRPTDEGRKPPHENAHNYFIQVAAETGLFGLLGFLWIVFTGMAAGFTRPLNEEGTRARLLTIGIAGYLITALSGHPLVLSEQAFLFWGYLGILAGCSRVGQATCATFPPVPVSR